MVTVRTTGAAVWTRLTTVEDPAEPLPLLPLLTTRLVVTVCWPPFDERELDTVV